MIDRAHIGRELPSHTATVEAGRLRFFAKATGEDRPEYLDDMAAREAGHRGLPAPPSFLFTLENDVPDATAWIGLLGMNLSRILHGEQSFTYHRDVCAGDVLTFHPRIEDIYEKKGGVLEFIVRATRVADRSGDPVADLKTVLVYRND